MKGLLLKDCYMMKKYCKAYLLFVVIFIALSFVSNNNMFLVFYPCLLCGMIPVNLLAYDERSHWEQYSGALPYTKSQIVSGKYLISLLLQAAILLLTGIAQVLRISWRDGFSFNEFTVIMLTMFIISTIFPSISLPFIFKYGVEKGRIIYYVMIGFVSVASAIAANSFRAISEVQPIILLVLLSLAGIGIYALSWYLSIVFYKKREF